MNDGNCVVWPWEEQDHSAICIPFTVGGVQFEAIGFILVGQRYCLGNEAIRRVDNGNVVRTFEDWRVLYENRDQLPEELRKYCLITSKQYQDHSQAITYLVGFSIDTWYVHWLDLDGKLLSDYLVVRRCLGGGHHD